MRGNRPLRVTDGPKNGWAVIRAVIPYFWPDKTAEDAGKTKARVIVGFRPEQMSLTEAGRGTTDVTVTMTEITGADSYVNFALGTKTVTARVAGRFRQPDGSKVGLSLDTRELRFFDAESEVLLS